MQKKSFYVSERMNSWQTKTFAELRVFRDLRKIADFPKYKLNYQDDLQSMLSIIFYDEFLKPEKAMKNPLRFYLA